MSEWKKTTLSHVAEIIGGFAFKGEHFSDDGDSTVIKIKDIQAPVINIDGATKVFMENYSKDKLEKFLLKRGDFALAMTGATIGKIGKLISDKQAYINQRVAKIDPHRDVSKEFVYYCISGDDFQVFIQNNIDSHSAQENISATSIGRYPIDLPCLTEQKAIAEVLSSLDDKIDLLHRQNKTLESLAETLFHQWFIEEAQDEWEEKGLLDLINLIGGGTPKTSVPEFWDGEYFWLSGGDIASSHKGFVTRSEKTITQNGLDSSSAKLLPQFATVITARGTVGKFGLLSKPMAYSQSNYGVMPKVDGCFFFSYLLINHAVSELQSSAYGSVFDTITTTTFKDISLKVPSSEAIIDFEKRISPYFLKKLSCHEQIQSLEKIRDTLLPKLMCGEVRVQYREAV